MFFVISTSVVLDTVFFLDDPRTDSDDIFKAAGDINKISVFILIIIGIIFIAFAYMHIFSTYKKLYSNPLR
jgi:hypothetical protein